jgi:thiol-disulfide isomerase/thioredoxin
MKPVLKIFVTDDCPSCIEARTVAARIEQNYPDLIVEVIDMTDSQAVVSEAVFATPTYMLNNRVVSLGNPKLDEVVRWIKAVPEK